MDMIAVHSALKSRNGQMLVFNKCIGPADHGYPEMNVSNTPLSDHLKYCLVSKNRQELHKVITHNVVTHTFILAIGRLNFLCVADYDHMQCLL